MKHSDYFERLHPFIPCLYYIAAVTITMFCMHPAVILISFLSPLVYGVWLNGAGVVRRVITAYLPLGMIAVIFNVLFNHRGETILCYLNDNPLTLESIVYGGILAVILIDVVLWFGCFHRIMTADKLMCVTGKIIPLASLMISMSLRFVPRYQIQLKKIIYSQKAVGRDLGKGNLLHRLIISISCVSILIKWALENSLETAASMKSRGFGLKGRTSYTPFRFTKRDFMVLIQLVVLGCIMLVCAASIQARYSPYIQIAGVTTKTVFFLGSYLVFCNVPMLFNMTKERRRCFR